MTARNRGTTRGWYVDFTIEFPDGTSERFRRKSPINTKKGAEQFERDLRTAELENWRLKHLGLDLEIPTIGEFEDEFFGVLEDAGLKQSTLDSYRTIMRLHILPHFGQMGLDKIGPRDIEAFKRSKRELAAKTVRNFLTVLSKLFSTARRLDIVRETPHIEMPRRRSAGDDAQGFDFWDFDEAGRVLDQVATEPRVEGWIRLALATGLRAGELTALQWGDIDLEKRVLAVRRQQHKGNITTPKWNRLRSVPLSAAALEALEIQKPRTFMRALSGEGWVFEDEHGRFDYNRIDRPFRRLQVRAGVKRIRIHDLRHTFASHCVMRGVPIEVIQQWLGHSDIRMTMRYAHLAPDHAHRFVELLDGPPNKGEKNGKLHDYR